MSLRLWLVRHGPTHAKGPVGWRDLAADLSDIDRLNRLRAALPADAPVISSDLHRATATADALLQQGPRLPHDPALREINFGAWDGVQYDQLRGDDVALSRQFWDNPGDIAPPDGESWNQMSSRVNAAIDALRGLHQGDLVVVAHFGAILSIIQRAAGIAPRAAFAFTLAPLSLSCVDDLGQDRWRVERVNHQP